MEGNKLGKEIAKERAKEIAKGEQEKHKEIMRSNKFFEMLESNKCPICNGKMDNVDKIIIRKARSSTEIEHCPNCEILVGRST